MIITDTEKLACVRRELAMRRRVYPRWVESGKYDEAKCAHELACMEAIVSDYEALARQESPPEPDLFSQPT